VRILFLTHRLPYAANRGDRIRALRILRLLARHHQVDLISLVHSADEESHAADLGDLVSSLTPVRVSRMRSWMRALAALPTTGTLTHAMLDAPHLKSAIARRIGEHRPDVVLAYCSGMTRFALEPPLDALPFVLDMLDVDSEKWRALSETAAIPWRWLYGIEARRLAAFEATASRAARSVLVVNEREQAALLKLAPSATVHVVPVGVDLDEFRAPPGPRDGRHVCFCGVMNYPPNEAAALWFAREVWPSIRARFADARFLILGSDPTPAIRRLPSLDPTVEVTGAVPDVRPYLWRSAVSVAPLFVARGVQNKVLEAVAAGLPCVVTPAVREGLPDDVLPACREATDVASFAAGVIGLLTLSPAERQATAARADLTGLGWDARLQPILGILEQARR